MDFTQFFNPAAWGSWAPAASDYTGPTGNIGYGTGVGVKWPHPCRPDRAASCFGL